MSSIQLQSAVLQVILEHIGIFWLGSCLEDDDGTTAALGGVFWWMEGYFLGAAA